MKRLRLFPRLMLSFLVFAAGMVLALGGSFLVTSLFILGDPAEWNFYAEAGPDGLPEAPERVEKLGGWVEQLDSDWRVIRVYGDKKTETMQYTTALIAALTGTGEETSSYIGFLGREVEDTRLLSIYSRRDVQVNTQLDVSPGNANAAWGRAALFLFAGLFLLLMALMSLFLVRKIRRPLDAITAGMRRVRRGEEGVRLDFAAEADFAEIRDTFNAMIEEQELQRRQRLETEAQRSRLLLELSHDLRTPVATIQSVAAALRENLVPEDERARWYTVIFDKAQRVHTLSESLFTLLKIEDAALPGDEVFDLAELLREVCGHYYTEIEGANLSLEARIPEETVTVSGDAQLLARAIGNLIENAVRYNRTGREIRVSMKEDETFVRILVEDDGAPIPATDRPHLFDAFTRGDRARTSGGGTGLGLSIARSAVEKHGGRICYEEADGNRFVMELPRN